MCALALAVAAGNLPAQSGEQIRSVTSMAFAAFPEADRVSNIVRDIDVEARKRIEKELPFKIHFQELGEHKLHVAFRGPRPVGLLYMRSEQTEWGIADIGWALSLECRVLGFEFANSRSDETKKLPKSDFAKSLIGRGFREIVAVHNARARPAGETVTRSADRLTRIVLRSAMKATLVTELVWADQVSVLADLAMVYDELPGAKPGRRRVVEFGPKPGKPRRLLTLHVIEANGQAGYSLGKVIRSSTRIGEKAVELRWVLDTRGRIVHVTPSASWPGEKLRISCGALQGRPLADTGLPANPLTEVAAELSEELARIRWSRPRK